MEGDAISQNQKRNYRDSSFCVRKLPRTSLHQYIHLSLSQRLKTFYSISKLPTCNNNNIQPLPSYHFSPLDFSAHWQHLQLRKCSSAAPSTSTQKCLSKRFQFFLLSFFLACEVFISLVFSENWVLGIGAIFILYIFVGEL